MKRKERDQGRAAVPQVETLEGRALMASIGGFAFADSRVNGILDDDEFGQGGIEVKLFSPGRNGRIGGGDDRLLRTTVTGNNGAYQFGGLAAGKYIVRFEPENLRFGPQRRGKNRGLDSDVVPDKGRTELITVRAKENNFSISAALYDPTTPGRIGGTVNGIETFQVDLATVVPGVNAFKYEFANLGGQPAALPLIDSPPDDDGRQWIYVTLPPAGRILQPGETVTVTIRYRGQVLGQFGAAGSLVNEIGGDPFDTIGPNITAIVVDRRISTLAAPRENDRRLDFTVVYRTEADTIDINTVGTGDVAITGPRGFQMSAKLMSRAVQNNGNTVVARYRISAPGGDWGREDNGRYRFVMRAPQVLAGERPLVFPAGVMQVLNVRID